jgi:hypothetical protein
MNSKYENARRYVLQATGSFPPCLSPSLPLSVLHCMRKGKKKKEESKGRRIFDATPWRRVAREMI